LPTKYLSHLNSALLIFCYTLFTHTHSNLEVSIFFNWYQGRYTRVWINFLSVIHIFVTSFIMNSSMLSEENSDNELFEYFLKLSKISKNSNKELKKVKQKKVFNN
jgi:hypothetical protein